MPHRPERLILIHGAWAGPWVWDALLPELDRLGWHAEALSLPGDGTHPTPPKITTEDDFHACLSKAILAKPGPVVLVGHSGGGMLVTAGAMAHPEKVSHGVWVAGMLIPDGRSFDDIQEDIAGTGQRIGITPFIKVAPDGKTSTVPRTAAMEHFFQDAPAELAQDAAAKLTPQPTSGHRIRTQAGPTFDRLPKLYVHAAKDRSVLPEAQDLMARSAPNVTCKRMNTGHAPQLTKPRHLARLISDWLDDT